MQRSHFQPVTLALQRQVPELSHWGCREPAGTPASPETLPQAGRDTAGEMGRPQAREGRRKPSLPAKPWLGRGFGSRSPARRSPTHLRGGSGRAGRLPAPPSDSGSAGSARSGDRPCCRGSCGSGPRARCGGTAPGRRSTPPSGRCSCKLLGRQEGWSAALGHGAYLPTTSWGGWMSQRGFRQCLCRWKQRWVQHGADGCTHGIRKCQGILRVML